MLVQQQDNSPHTKLNELLEQLESAIFNDEIDVCITLALHLDNEIKNCLLTKIDPKEIEYYLNITASLIEKINFEKEKVGKELLKCQTGKKVAYAYKKL
jgi:hypothetical protein